MAGKLEQELDTPEISLSEKRITDLSEKVKLTSRERDELADLNKKLELEKQSAQKEVEFYKGFSQVSGTYSKASEHTDEIKTKVLAGYTIEDATVSVLAKAGKLTGKPEERTVAAGGSATNPPSSKAEKSINDMTRDEKRQALMDAQSRGELVNE